MKKYLSLLIFLVASLSITGISFFDDIFWDKILVGLGMASYSIVGGLFYIGLLKNKQDGKDAYVVILFILLLGLYGVYKGILRLKAWIVSWHLAFKIIVPIVLLGLIILVLIFVIKHWDDYRDYD